MMELVTIVAFGKHTPGKGFNTTSIVQLLTFRLDWVRFIKTMEKTFLTSLNETPVIFKLCDHCLYTSISYDQQNSRFECCMESVRYEPLYHDQNIDFHMNEKEEATQCVI